MGGDCSTTWRGPAALLGHVVLQSPAIRNGYPFPSEDQRLDGPHELQPQSQPTAAAIQLYITAMHQHESPRVCTFNTTTTWYM